MIVLKEPIDRVTAEKFARFILFSVDRYAVITHKDDGRVIISSEKQGAVLNALNLTPDFPAIFNKTKRSPHVHVLDQA